MRYFPTPWFWLHLMWASQHQVAAQTFENVLKSYSELSQLLSLIYSVPQLMTTFNSNPNWTYLAPSNDAINDFLNSNTGAGTALTTDTSYAQALLVYHAIVGAYPTITEKTFMQSTLRDILYSNVSGGAYVEAIPNDGSPVIVSGLMQNSSVTRTVNFDLNGTLRVIDRVLTLAPNITSTATTLNLTSAIGAFDTVGLSNTIDLALDTTIFLPLNDAFQHVGQALSNMSTQQLTDVLEYHVLSSTLLYSTAMADGSKISSSSGNSITISRQGDSTYINNARIVIPDVLVSNGVMHVIDRVLNPQNSSAPQGTEAFETVNVSGDVPFTSSVPAPTSPSTESVSSGGSKSNIGAIAGGVVGGLAAIAAIVFAIWFCRRKRRKDANGRSEKQQKVDTLNRSGTTKSFNKPELAGSEGQIGYGAYHKAELGAKEPIGVATAVPYNISPRHAKDTELSAEERHYTQLSASDMSAHQQTTFDGSDPSRFTDAAPRAPPSAIEYPRVRPSSPVFNNASDSRAAQRRLMELENERRQAELDYEHQKRMAHLEHERRLTELSLSGNTDLARNKSHDSPWELDADNVQKSPEDYRR